MTAVSPYAVESLLKLSDKELYVMLSASFSNDNLFNEEGRVQEGKEAFIDDLNTYRASICMFYKKNKDDLPQIVALISGLASYLSTGSAQFTLPAVPFSILVVRYGFAAICGAE